MTSIHPFLWFENRDAEAARTLLRHLQELEDHNISRSPSDNPSTKPAGAHRRLKLEGNPVRRVNGGKQAHHFNESVSFVVNCETQKASTTTGTS